MRLSSSTQNESFLNSISEAYHAKNITFLIQNLDNPVSVVFKDSEQLTLPVIQLIPDIFDKILAQTELNLIKISYLSSICIIQLSLDLALEMLQKSQIGTLDLSNDNNNQSKQWENQLMNKDLIFNQIFRDLCQQDEVAATLKICMITECFLQNDTFKEITKKRAEIIYKVLTMTLQDQNMALLLGPRALQFLSLILLKNKNARKKFHKLDVVKDFVRNYVQMEPEKQKKLRVFLIAKQVLPTNESNQLAKELGLERSLLQFKDYDSISFFISRIPFNKMVNLKDGLSFSQEKVNEELQFPIFSTNDGEKKQKQSKEVWFTKIKYLNKTVDYSKQKKLTKSMIIYNDSIPIIDDYNLLSQNCDHITNNTTTVDDFSLNLKTDNEKTLQTLVQDNSFMLSLGNGNKKGPKEVAKQQLIKDKRAEKLHENQNSRFQCCTNHQGCSIV